MYNIFFLILLFTYIYSVSLNKEALNFAKEYLKKYGYLSSQYDLMSDDKKEKMLEMGVKNFQNFAGMDMTGNMDEKVMEMMRRPRCGVPDMDEDNEEFRKKRYAIYGTHWNQMDLTFKIDRYTEKLGYVDQEVIVQNAFDIWSKYVKINVKRINEGEANFKVHFTKRDNNPNAKFDGKGKVLGLAYFPRNGGIYLDDDEDWNSDFLYEVVAHEVGHALGLAHSNVQESLMAPYYHGDLSFKRNLHRDDINGIQSLYAKQDMTRIPKCDMNKINSIFISNNQIYVIVGNEIFIKNLYVGIWKRYNIGDYFKGMKDVRGFSHKGKIYLFKNHKFWVYKGNDLDGIYPKLISKVFPGVPSCFDAATEHNGYIYFFKDNKFWKYNSELKQVMPGYPKTIISSLNNIDAIYFAAGNFMFFKNGNHYWYVNKIVRKQSIQKYFKCI